MSDVLPDPTQPKSPPEEIAESREYRVRLLGNRVPRHMAEAVKPQADTAVPAVSLHQARDIAAWKRPYWDTIRIESRTVTYSPWREISDGDCYQGAGIEDGTEAECRAERARMLLADPDAFEEVSTDA